VTLASSGAIVPLDPELPEPEVPELVPDEELPPELVPEPLPVLEPDDVPVPELAPELPPEAEPEDDRPSPEPPSLVPPAVPGVTSMLHAAAAATATRAAPTAMKRDGRSRRLLR
jgi:hypothetical protein